MLLVPVSSIVLSLRLLVRLKGLEPVEVQAVPRKVAQEKPRPRRKRRLKVPLRPPVLAAAVEAASLVVLGMAGSGPEGDLLEMFVARHRFRLIKRRLRWVLYASREKISKKPGKESHLRRQSSEDMLNLSGAKIHKPPRKKNGRKSRD